MIGYFCSAQYLRAVSELARYHGRSPSVLEPGDVDAWFRHLVVERKLAPASCRLYLNGVRYLYLKVLEHERFDVEVAIPKVPQRIPELLTREDLPSRKRGGHESGELLLLSPATDPSSGR